MIGKRQMIPYGDYVCREAESPTPTARPACAYPWNAGWPEEGNASPQPAEHHKNFLHCRRGLGTPLRQWQGVFGMGVDIGMYWGYSVQHACKGAGRKSRKADFILHRLKGRYHNPVNPVNLLNPGLLCNPINISY